MPSPHTPERLGPTRATGAPGRALIVFCVVAIFSVPLVQNLAELRGVGPGNIHLPQCYDVFKLGPGLAELASVRRLRDAANLLPTVPELLNYEEALENQSVVASIVRPRIHEWLTDHLRVGTERAWVGRAGWLFFSPGITHLTAPGFLEPRALRRRARSAAPWNPPIHPNPLDAILDFRNQLAVRGIELVVLPVPPKAAIHPEEWSARYQGIDHPLHNRSFRAFRDNLESEGVWVFDPSGDLWKTRQEYGSAYLDTDSHWTPQGATATARSLAKVLRKTLGPGHFPRPFERSTAIEIENDGDVAIMLGLPDARQKVIRENVTIQPVSDSQGNRWRPDPRADVLLLGDSYSNIYSHGDLGWGEGAGFVEQLSVELGRPIDAIRMNAGGPQATRRVLSDAMAHGQDRLAGKKIVIYEFAAHELSWGNWAPVKLGTAAPGSQGEDGGTIGTTIVRGRITALSGIPTPGSTPYRDCIVSIRMADVRGETGEMISESLVAYIWGLRDDRPTEAARFRVGQDVRLRLSPWSQVQERLGSHQRVELDEPGIHRQAAHWAAPVDETPIPPSIETRRQQPETGKKVDSDPFRSEVSRRAAEAEKRGDTVVRGRDGWLFLVGEFLHLGMGRFTEQGPDGDHNPATAIIDFHEQLARAGIELIFVPVPAKAVIYPDEALPGWQGPELATGPRLDPYHQDFYADLRSRGVNVIDLVEDFRAARDAGGATLFCQRDSHWSGAASRIAANRIADIVRSQDWAKRMSPTEMTVEHRDVEILGDLARNLGDPTLGTENIGLDFVTRRIGNRQTPIQPSETSPFLVLSDSHGLIFHAGGDMHATGAGLPDHLALELGFPVDLIAVRGSGANAPRVTLARNPDRLRGKRCVLWIVNSPSLTRTVGRWQKIEVIP